MNELNAILGAVSDFLWGWPMLTDGISRMKGAGPEGRLYRHLTNTKNAYN